jgi:general secretion pathway protein A
MTLGSFQFKEQPFGVTPDPRYLYCSATHREALASLYYGVSARRGFTALIARPGMGKTTLLFEFLTKIGGSARTVFLFQPQLTPRDLLRSVLEDLAVEHDASDVGEMQRKLNECLVGQSKEGKQIIVVIDEAQNLDERVLEVVRMLSNFETPREKLMHLILAGQPDLAATLASPRMVQLRQRISIVARLKPFDLNETNLYIDHRLRVAGYEAKTSLFSKRALEMVAYHSGGIPRNINTLCFNSLSMACALKARTIDVEVVEEVLGDLDLNSLFQRSPKAPGSEVRVAQLERPTSKVRSSSRLPGWWPRVAASLCLLVALGAILTKANWNSLRIPRSFSFQSAQATSLPVRPTEEVKIDEAAKSKQGTGSASIGWSRSIDAPDRVEPDPSLSKFAAIPPATASLQRPNFVIVRSNQTIFRICIKTMGKYNDRTLARIRELNPNLTDVNRLEIGQKIRVPAEDEPGSTRISEARETAPPLANLEKP